MFEYDVIAPLEVVEHGVRQTDFAAVRDISYRSPMGGRVPAFLVTPLARGRFAGVVLMHWGFGDRASMLEEALLYARAGAVCILPDGYPWKRPERAMTDFSTAEGVHDAYVQLVIDLHRAIDILFSRLDVSSNRIAYVGHSLGATVGGALAGPCERVSAYVLMDGYPQVSLDERLIQKNFPGREGLFADLNAIRYIGLAAPAAVFFQFARRSEFITELMADQWFKAAKDPKDLKWYDTDHAFDLSAFRDRAEWLHHRIGLPPVDSSWLGARTTLLPKGDLTKFRRTVAKA